MELADSLDQGQTYWQTGDIIKIVVGVLIVGGALYAIYSRWDAGGCYQSGDGDGKPCAPIEGERNKVNHRCRP